jgi:hypothetical protein
MTQIPLQICETSKQLLEPRLHDGKLLAISSRDAVVELTVADVSHNRYRVVLDGVADFQANEFRQGNIILDVTISRGKDVGITDLADLLFRGMSLEEYEPLHERIVRESLYVVRLNPSYGCRLVAVAKHITIERVEPC